MANEPRPNLTLDRDLKKINKFEQGVADLSQSVAATGIAVAFIVLAAVAAAMFFGLGTSSYLIIAASAIGAYMAINIGANDVANNVGPAVGSNAMTLGTALIIAALCESAGALLAGGDVVGTISKGIIDPASVSDPTVFMFAMMAALISASLWLNLATYIGAPVSTTHAIVGGVMGAGIAAAGFAAVNWPKMGQIAASWVISPVMGGVIAALFLWFIKSNIVYKDDKIAAARRWVPVLVAIMAGAFGAYLAIKGFKKVIKIELEIALLFGFIIAVVTYFFVKPLIRKQSEGMENSRKSVRQLFTIPLIFSAALLSFAHGANDVANAVGPLAAIVHTADAGEVLTKVSIPLWVMAVGAIGISIGLLLFGPKLIRMVGSQITKLNQMRAYCVALSAAITVIIASWLGLPVSSTHIAVGGVFGVGFFREWHWRRNNKPKAVQSMLVADLATSNKKRKNRKLVRRTHFSTIIAAWVITVPAAALLSAVIYTILHFVAG